ncbi:MAG: glycosyltransferase [Roseinatronobacter sp.]
MIGPQRRSNLFTLLNWRSSLFCADSIMGGVSNSVYRGILISVTGCVCELFCFGWLQPRVGCKAQMHVRQVTCQQEGIVTLSVWIDKLQYQFARYRWLRTCYRDYHLNLSLPSFALPDSQGTISGYLEEIRIHQGRLYIRGWSLASRVGIRLGATQIWCRPHEERDDVAHALGCTKNVGFRASLPFEDSVLHVELEHEGSTLAITRELEVARALRRTETRLNLKFWRDMLPIVPMVMTGLRRNDPDLPRRVKAALGLGLHEAEALLDPASLASASRPAADAVEDHLTGSFTLILPIYNAFDLLPEMLDRVMNHTDLPFRLIVIDDCSSDTRVRPWLRAWAARHDGQERAKVKLIENARNLGFIGTVNRGLDLAQDDHGPVVLLNSDAMVPEKWASRLVAALADPDVATATPLSNDAEIFSIPIVCSPGALEPGQGDAIDAALRARIAPGLAQITAPTGVGFCMALQRAWITRLGGFDTIFGRGYGEEVDWCRRAAAQGGRHVAVPRLFVEHRGGASFGSDKQALVQQNNAIISTRYPGYDQMVQDFIRNDPLITPRLVAALAWADNRADLDEIPVYIGHSLGGGAENYLQDRIRKNTVSLVLRFGGAFRIRIELDTPLGRLVANTDDPDLMVQLLTPIKKRRIIYSCAVGDPDLAALPGWLLRLSEGAALEILFHDYLPISPSYTLLDHDGVFRGVPASDQDDPAHRYRRGDGTEMLLADWRAAWECVIDTADRLQVFSEASARIVTEAYPQAAARLQVTPHTGVQVPAAPLPRRDRRRVIAALGAIGPHKGAAVLSALSSLVTGRKDVSLVLIGRIAPGYPLSSDTPVHGPYAVEDIPHLVARYGVTHWLIPSVWPETFSYTVHECLATGLPTLAFDLGAQGDAVRQAENGIVLCWQQSRRSPESLARLVVDAVCETADDQPRT